MTSAGRTGRRSTASLARHARSKNFGWPCYEGIDRQPGYDAANLNICETSVQPRQSTPPFFRYSHSAQIVPNENCVSLRPRAELIDFRCRVRVLHRRVSTRRRMRVHSSSPTIREVYLGNQDGIAEAFPSIPTIDNFVQEAGATR